MSSIDGKSVLVTGGTGSIGSTLVEFILNKSPEKVRVIDNNESRLFELKRQKQSSSVPFETDLVNIRNARQVRASMKGIDIVFHAAALKHVGLVEQNPYAAVETNIQGTKNIVDSAIKENVESLITVSTDKASNPISTMGATKLVAERLTLAKNDYAYRNNTKLGCVRFGNVLGSRGSVIPLFLDQLDQDQPLTVTDETMTRFIMTPHEAAKFVVEAHSELKGGDVFIKKMPAFQLGDLVTAIREGFAEQFDRESGDVEIEDIGAQPGERYHEKLISRDELRFTEERDDRFVLVPNIQRATTPYDKLSHSLNDEYTSQDTKKLSKNEIIEMIESIGVTTLLSNNSQDR